MDDVYSFGAWVGRRRRALRLTQHEVAGLVACSLVLIQKIEADARRPSPQMATRLAQVLQIAPDHTATFVRVARAELAVDRLPAPDHGTIRMVVGATLVQNPTQPAGNVPSQVSSFHGREREIRDLHTFLHQDGIRLITLTGAGGSGKTRLALRAADPLHHEYTQGIWFIDLSPISDPEQIATTMAQVLGLPESPDRPIRDDVLNWLRQRQILLILDNCEQVLAGVVDVVTELLRGAPRLTVLATSRIPLRITGEQEYVVAPLGLPPPTVGTLKPSNIQTFDVDLSQYDAIALFMSRARAVRADFRLTNANAPAIAAICVGLDGLPLAIELAAARIRLFPPEQLLNRLGSARLHTLTGGARDLPARQQTIRATIDWSYRLLTRPQHILFARLSVFVGGWTIEAAEAIGTPPIDVVNLLDGLVEHNLVRLQETNGEPRYTMLETIREYALERLAERGEIEHIQ